MKTTITKISLLLCVAVALSSCHRKPIYDSCLCQSTLSIPIDIDWETSGIDLQNVSVLFYDAEDGSLQYEHIYEHNSKDVQSYASLPTGSYTAVIFNELRGQIDYLSCVDHENISTLHFVSNSEEPLRSRAATRSYIAQSGDLAVAVVEGIEVTDDMILEASAADDSDDTKALSTATKTTVESLMGITTVKKNTTIYVTAHVQNIYYARMPSLVDLTNLADGYYVYSDANSSSTSTLQFTMNNRTYYEGSYYDGYIYTTVTAFGSLEDRTSTASHDASSPIMLDLLFKMVDAEQSEQTLTMDVTDQIVHQTLADGSITMTIEVEFSDPLTPVEPEGSAGDSGFGSEVEDWDVVYVPLGQ